MSVWPTSHELLLSHHKSVERRSHFARARLAELLSNAPKDFLREPRILHGASQYYATDHRRYLKNGFFSLPTPSGEEVLKSLLEHSFEFRARASHLLGQRGHGAAVAWIVPVPPAQVPISIRSFALGALYALQRNLLAVGNGGCLQFLLRTEMGIKSAVCKTSGFHYFTHAHVLKSP